MSLRVSTSEEEEVIEQERMRARVDDRGLAVVGDFGVEDQKPLEEAVKATVGVPAGFAPSDVPFTDREKRELSCFQHVFKARIGRLTDAEGFYFFFSSGAHIPSAFWAVSQLMPKPQLNSDYFRLEIGSEHGSNVLVQRAYGILSGSDVMGVPSEVEYMLWTVLQGAGYLRDLKENYDLCVDGRTKEEKTESPTASVADPALKPLIKRWDKYWLNYSHRGRLVVHDTIRSHSRRLVAGNDPRDYEKLVGREYSMRGPAMICIDLDLAVCAPSGEDLDRAVATLSRNAVYPRGFDDRVNSFLEDCDEVRRRNDLEEERSYPEVALERAKQGDVSDQCELFYADGLKN